VTDQLAIEWLEQDQSRTIDLLSLGSGAQMSSLCQFQVLGEGSTSQTKQETKEPPAKGKTNDTTPTKGKTSQRKNKK
jgi:hypothetical protein